jgi:RNA polymerase sigma factor (sigma-70 family)
MIESGSLQQCECNRRLTGLHLESHKWLVTSANKITKNKEESEDLVQELYEYLHKKCNPKLFYGENTYNLFYCHKFLHSRFMNKTKKLNRITYGYESETNDIQDIPYNEELDLKLEEAHNKVMETLKTLATTKHWPQARIFELYWCSTDTLDEVAKKIKISKSTTFLAVKKIRKLLKEVIDNPFDDKKEI